MWIKQCCIKQNYQLHMFGFKAHAVKCYEQNLVEIAEY